MYTKIDLIRINDIACMYYRRGKKSRNLVIYGPGAPIVPDNGNLPDAKIISLFDTDLIVPDYIGYGRSGGKFTPKNCILTFIKLNNQLKKGCIAKNNYSNEQLRLNYKRIIFIGRSLGGTYLPLLPKYDPTIKDLGLIYPAVDNASCGSVKGEETNEEFLNAMSGDGYKYLYRGILDPIWKKHLQNLDGLSPVDNIKYLSKVRMFIGHGKKDKCIHYSKSVKYFQDIVKFFPENKNQFVIKVYPNTGHEPATSNVAAYDFLEWLGLPKI